MSTDKETGCYVDSWRGIYAPMAMLEMANGFGFPMTAAEFKLAASELSFNDPTFNESELINDLVQRAEDWLNANEVSEGHSWYWFDGMFGYWSNDDEELN